MYVLGFLEMPVTFSFCAGIAGGKNDHYPLLTEDLWPWSTSLSLSNVDACGAC